MVGQLSSDSPDVIRRQTSDPTQQFSQQDPNEPPKASFDPAAVDVEDMTNEAFNVECLRVDDWLAAHVDESDPDHSAYLIFRGRLRTERERRIDLGHLWLTQGSSTPAALYQLVPGMKGRTNVVSADLSVALGAPQQTLAGPLMTPAQFEAYLRAQALQTIEYATYQKMIAARRGGPHAGTPDDPFGLGLPEAGAIGTLGAGAFLDPQAKFLAPTWAKRPGSARWRGDVVETLLQRKLGYGYGMLLTDFNNQDWVGRAGETHSGEKNYPGFDAELNWLGRALYGKNKLIQMTHSAQPNQSERIRTFMEKYAKVLGTERAPPGQSTLDLFLANQPGRTRESAVEETELDINLDDIAAMRTELEDPTVLRPETRFGKVIDPNKTRWQTDQYRRIYEGILKAHPVTIKNVKTGQDVVFNDIDALDHALANGDILPADHIRAQQEIGVNAGSKLGGDVATATIRQLEQARLRLGSQRLAKFAATPEYLAAELHPEGLLGATRSSIRGGVASGAVIAALIDLVQMGVLNPGEVDWTKIKHDAEANAVGGGVAAPIEQYLVARSSQQIVAQGGLSASSLAMRFGGRFGGGGVAGLAVEDIGMAVFEDREHSGEEIAERSIRAFVIGGTSTLAGAEVGALVGSAVPIVGTVIGFIVGAAVGWALSEAIPGGKEDWDQKVMEDELKKMSPPENDPSIQAKLDSDPATCVNCQLPASSASPGKFSNLFGTPYETRVGVSREDQQYSIDPREAEKRSLEDWQRNAGKPH
jgi:hypothetical protein